MKLVQRTRSQYLQRQSSVCSHGSASSSSCESTIAVNCCPPTATTPTATSFVADQFRSRRRRQVSFDEGSNIVHASEIELTVQECQHLWYSKRERAIFRQRTALQVEKLRTQHLESPHCWSRVLQDFYDCIHQVSCAAQAIEAMQDMQAVYISDEVVGLEKHFVASEQRKQSCFDLVDAVLQIQDSEGFMDDDDDRADTMRTASRFESRANVFLAYFVAEQSYRPPKF